MKLLTRAGIVLLALLCGASVVWIVYGGAASEPQVGNANVVGGIASVLALVITTFTVWWRKPSLDEAATPPTERMRHQLNLLATEELRFWQTQAHDRRITTPVPAAIGWTWAADSVAAPAADIDPTLLTDGVVTRLRKQVYGRHPEPTRLVILGAAGAGKTTAMLLLLIDVLKHRERNSDDPVPVWVTVGGWNPKATPLLKWVSEAVNRDFGFIGTVENGSLVSVAALLHAGRIALFLDGLDEMPETFRGPALRTLDRETAGLNVVLTCRSAEYQAALAHGRLWRSAVIELLPASIDNVRDFLLAEQFGERRKEWQVVTHHLIDSPHGVVARTLASPLALSLARETYVRDDPAEMLNADAFPTPEALQRHLFKRLVMLAFPDDKQRRRTVGMLAMIASRMGGSRDLLWWEIPTWLLGPRPVPWLYSAVFLGMFTGLGLTAHLANLRPDHNLGLIVGLWLVIAVAVGGGCTIRGEHRQRVLVAVEGGSQIFRPWFRAVYVRTLTAAACRLTVAEGPNQMVARWPNRRALRAMLTYGAFCAAASAPPFIYMVGWSGVLFAVTAGVAVGTVTKLLVFWRKPVTTAGIASPMEMYQMDRRSMIVGSTVGAILGGLTGVAAFAGADVKIAGVGIACGFYLGLSAGLLAGSGPTWELWASGWLLSRRVTRHALMSVLQTADNRQILRKVGAIYQFRHAALQDLLASEDLAVEPPRSSPKAVAC